MNFKFLSEIDDLRGFADAPIILLRNGFELFRGDFRKLP